MLYLVAVTAATLLVENAAEAAVWHVPLERHARSLASAVADAHHPFADAVNAKRQSVWAPAFPQDDLTMARHNPVPVDFRDISVDLFAAKFRIGRPPQTVSLGLDWLSLDVLVINHKVGAHAFYDHSKSTTYKANGTQVRLDEGTPYELHGFVSNDRVSLGSVDTLEVRDQPLIELTGPDKFLNVFPPKLDGFVGFGPGRSNTTGAPSLMRSMIDQQLLDRPVLGLSFNEVVAHAMFGGIDPKYTNSDVHYFAQKQPSVTWTAPVSSIRVDGKRVVEHVGRVGIGCNDVILGPTDQVNALADAVGAENYALRCDGPGPDITFELADGFQVTLTKKHYAIPQGQGWCMFAFVPVSVSQWSVGMRFLRRVYTVLDFGASDDQERIGFAHIKP